MHVVVLIRGDEVEAVGPFPDVASANGYAEAWRLEVNDPLWPGGVATAPSVYVAEVRSLLSPAVLDRFAPPCPECKAHTRHKMDCSHRR